MARPLAILAVCTGFSLGCSTAALYAGSKNIWISASDLARRPMSGKAWQEVLAAAKAVDELSVQGGHDSRHDVYTMAAALVAVRMNDDKRRRIVANNIMKAVRDGVENDGNSLSLSRTVTGYILAADLIDLERLDPPSDRTFRTWVRQVIYELELDGATQVEKHEKRGNNHGTQAGVARIAAAIYLDNTEDLNRAAAVLKGWLGDRSSFSAFSWGDLCWQLDPNNPVGILPLGSTMLVAGEIRDVDGVQPDDQRRAGCPATETGWPPRTDVHVWGGLSGAVAQAYLLSRVGFDAWDWQDQAILRAVSWLQDPVRGNAPAEDDDVWILPLVDLFYGTDFWNGFPDDPGKQVGWTEWTHGGHKSLLLGLDLDLVGRGTIDYSPSAGPFPVGTRVTLTAVADSGWVFTGWDEDLSGAANPVTILMDDIKEVTAVFQRTARTVAVRPILSTAPINHADDAAIWVHPTLPDKSVVIGTDREDGIFVWDMNGHLLQVLPQNTRLYNVDLRQNVKFGSETADIVVANMRDFGKLAVFKVNADYESGEVLSQIAGRTNLGNEVQLDSYGFCLYKRPSDSGLFAFDRPKKSGSVRQYRLDFEVATNDILVTPIRDLNYWGGETKGLVADDALGFLYVAEKNDGVHKFHADPSSSGDRVGFFAIDDGIVPNREGLALHSCRDNTGYLILSSHGNASLKIYERLGANPFLKTVVLLDQNGVGGIATEGVEVTARATSSAFPNGLLVAQDDNSNRFHFYDWADIAQTDLTICADGTAVPRPDIAVEPSEYDFGALRIHASATQLFTVYNLGESDLSVSSVSLVENEHDQLTLGDEAAPFTLTPGETRPLYVGFDAASVGTTSAKLRLSSNDSDEPVLEVKISGRVQKSHTTLAPDIVAAPSEVIFAEVTLGDTAVAAVQIVNEGETVLNITGMDFVGEQAGAFTVANSQTSFALPSGAGRQFSILFHPNSVGAAASTLRIFSDDPDESSLDVRVTGAACEPEPEIAVAPSSHDYGEIAVGHGLSHDFEVLNRGKENLEIFGILLVGKNSSDFEIESSVASFTLKPGETSIVSVRLSPLSEEAKLQTALRIESNDPTNPVLDVALTGSSLFSTAVVFGPAHDAYVLSDDEIGNFGRSATLRALELTSSKLHTYLKFNVSGLTGPIKQALLRLTPVTSSVAGGSVFAVENDYSTLNAPWVETGLRWVNAPRIAGTPLSSVGATVANKVVEFDVTAAVIGNGVYSFGLTSDFPELTVYHSKEGTAPPQLLIKVLPLNVPLIASFSPTAAVVGTPVTVSGVNLSDVTQVTFNGMQTANFNADSDTLLTAVIPQGATSGKIALMNSEGLGSTMDDFVVIHPPTISGFSPAAAPPGTLVTISGNAFFQVSAVFFNGVVSRTFSVNSPTQLTALLPEEASRGPVSVTNPGGTGVSGDSFDVQFVPKIVAFSPTSGTAGTEVTLTGRHFLAAAQVSFNGSPADGFTVESDSLLRAFLPSGATSGKISVTNSDGTGTSFEDFVVLQVPKITGFAPRSGPAGTVVILAGENFDEVKEVAFGGIPVSFRVVSDTRLEAIVRNGAGTGRIRVVNSIGTGTTKRWFVVTGTASSLIFAPVQDAFVRAARPTNNYSEYAELRVRNPRAGHDNTYLKFDVQGLSGEVVNAAIRLGVIDPSPDGGSVYAVSDNYEGTTTPWTEDGLLWDNAPAISGAPLSANGEVNVDETVEFDVTSAVSGEGIYSFGIRNAANDAVKYSSKEGTSVPQLVIAQFVSNAPSVTSFAPTSAPTGVEVSILGHNFVGTSAVVFNGISAIAFAVVSDSLIKASVPADASTGRILVTNSHGIGESISDFRVIQGPQISTFAPQTGPIGTRVLVSGENLTDILSVFFNGIPASFEQLSANELAANVPDSASTGRIHLTNAAGHDTSASDFEVTDPPSELTFTPIHDTFARSSKPANHYGDFEELRVRDASGGPIHSYLQFDVQGLTGTVASAKVRLYVIDAGPDGGEIFLVSNNEEGSQLAWQEQQLTWAKAPAMEGEPLSSAGAVNVADTVEFDVTSAITRDGVFSFGLRNNSDDAVKYSSKEGVQSPQLLVELRRPAAKVFTQSRSDKGTHVEVQMEDPLPTEFRLSLNYPNPFNLQTNLEYHLPSDSDVTIRVFNLQGQLVRVLVDGYEQAGIKTIQWDGRNESGKQVASGLFFVLLVTEDKRVTRKIILQK